MFEAPVVEVRIVDWFDLAAYLCKAYKAQSQSLHLLNGYNDSYYYICAEPRSATVRSDWRQDILNSIHNDGGVEDYYLDDLIAMAIEDGHLPNGNYLIRLDW